MSLEILVGADPEVFMRKDGAFRSAHGAIPGDKKNPHKVKAGAVQVDGMALEFNIDPAKNEKEFVANLKTVMGVLQSMVPDYELAAVPVATFDAAHMEAQPLEALELGCEPDFNAWEGGAVNPRPDGKVNFRTGAGHVHIGWGKDFDINDPDHQEACQMVVKQLDYYLGLGSLVYDTAGQQRRVMYGAAGAYRPKSYGVEYRVLSNAWLKSEELMSWVFRMTKKGIDDLFANKKAYLNYGNEAKYLLREERPDMGTVAMYMCACGVECPPGYEYTYDEWGSVVGFRTL